MDDYLTNTQAHISRALQEAWPSFGRNSGPPSLDDSTPDRGRSIRALYSDSPPPPPDDDDEFDPPRSQSEPGRITHLQDDPLLEIKIYNVNEDPRLHNALMDTGAEVLWIARSLVQALGFSSYIDRSGSGRQAKLANDEIITASGTVELQWKVAKGKKIFHETFNVFESSHLDVVLGMEWLKKHKVVQFDIGGLYPFGEAFAETEGQKAAREAAEATQAAAAEASLQRKKKRQSEKKRRGNERFR